MPRRINQPISTPLDVGAVASLPDKLAAIQLDLRHLCYHDASSISPKAVVTIGDVCDRLHGVVRDVVRLVEYVDAQSRLGDGLAGTSGQRSKAGPGKDIRK